MTSLVNLLDTGSRFAEQATETGFRSLRDTGRRAADLASSTMAQASEILPAQWLPMLDLVTAVRPSRPAPIDDDRWPIVDIAATRC